MDSFEDVTFFFRHNEVGRRTSIETPYGRRLLCYCDLTATGRHLHFLEAWLRRVPPFYANSHTEISTTGRVMTRLREEARRLVRRSLNAGPEDEVIFIGSGATAAINKLVGLIGLRISEPLEREFGLSKAIPKEKRPVVFVGPYEHHSNHLPWLESVAEIVEIGITPEGRIDLQDLERAAATYAARPLRIGAFSAASNVTGVISDVPAICRVLHQHGAFACLDYAASGPYAPIDMHPADPAERIDALFISSHKFVGGPQGSGILAVNKALIRTRSPERPGGGTVDYVSSFGPSSVDYVARLDEREEGGTPAIVGDIRAGIGFLMKELAGPARILEHEVRLARQGLERLGRNPRIQLLGPIDLPRLAILSFNIKGLHHDFVSVLLDHLFGIQNRAGCSCAGPYGHRLLGIDQERSERYRGQIGRGVLGIKPGWVRVTLPYYAADEDTEYIFSAIEFVADHGREFLTEYQLGWLDGVWRHVERPTAELMPLEATLEAMLEASHSFAAGDHEQPLTDAQLRIERQRYLAEAKEKAEALRTKHAAHPPSWNPKTPDPEIDALRWFDYVLADAPWSKVPEKMAARPVPSRCHA